MKLNNKHFYLSVVLITLLVFIALLSAKYGAVNISLSNITTAFQKTMDGDENLSLNERIFLDIRLPRTILSLFVGATLAVGGVLVQALFRNPIVESGMIGTSSGAAFAVAFFIVVGSTLGINITEWSMPLFSCIGGFLGTAMVFLLSNSNKKGKSSIALLLLTGVAVNAVFLSGIGFMSYIGRDSQARSITFWNLGTLSGANWNAVQIVGITSLIGIFVAYRYGKHLNTLILGEEEAGYLGVNIKSLKIKIIILNAIIVSTATSFVGVIGFVGLIVPHLLRILVGSDNRNLILYACLLGAILLCLSDFVARILLSPAELPIGIVTSIVGVPVFILLLRKKNNFL
ncbi:FecCD family ABC transporter permease [Flavobacterium sp. T12S277]|uniref:FecCD family ABC transporter permease n=1 Tax=Flavobacterium sp. T12S277 TaxID=3402752 RepID=UPI003ADDE220